MSDGVYIACKAGATTNAEVPVLLADLADTRRAWQKAVRDDPAESARRRESDFLKPVNHDGKTLDFHALRHTCEAVQRRMSATGGKT
jgi:hypothetical protein